MIIKIKNLLDISSPYSFLSNGEVAGTSVLRVKNINSYAPSWAIQVGKTGEEQSEIMMLSSGAISGTSITTTANSRYAHPTDTPVYSIKYDQIVIGRSTSGTSGTASAIGTVTITPDHPYTQYDDTTGATSYAYRSWYKNSVTNEESSQSDWLTSGGFTFYSLAKIRDRVKRKLFSASYIKEDSTIDDWINEWMEQLNNSAIKVNQNYGMGTINVAFGTNGLGTITATDFVDVTKVVTTYNGTDKYLTGKKMDNTVFPQDTFNETHPYYSWVGDNVLRIRPSDVAGTAEISYSSIYSKLSNDTDEIPVVMRTYTQSFVDYSLAQAYYMDQKEGLGDRFNASAQNAKKLFLDQITPRSYTGPQTIEILETISGEDENSFQIR